jgi:hypothetical protein
MGQGARGKKKNSCWTIIYSGTRRIYNYSYSSVAGNSPRVGGKFNSSFEIIGMIAEITGFPTTR